MTDPSTVVVNHHRDHPRFADVTGLAATLAMLMTGHAGARLAVELARVSDTDRVVDLGCDPGNAARAAARRGARVAGVDPARVMLRLAWAVTRDKSRVSWYEGAAEQLPLPDRWATVVWSLKTVHHWQDVTSALEEVRRVLAPGGRLLVTERCVLPGATGLASHGWTEQQAECFAARCRQARLDAVRTKRHPAGRHDVWAVHAIRA